MSDCIYCRNPATKLCDYVIGFEAKDAMRDKDGKIHLLADKNSEMFTCDAPLCDEHANQIGWMSGEYPDTIDRCKCHSKQFEKSLNPIFKNEADKIRRKIHAEIRRQQLKAIKEPSC